MFFVCAEVAELVDALGSGSSPGLRVGVRVSPSAPLQLFATISRGCEFTIFSDCRLATLCRVSIKSA